MTHRVYIGLGSNLGDSREIVLRATEQIGELLSETRRSSLYRTRPVGVAEQPDFLNAVAVGDFPGTAEALLSELQKIERGYGRDRNREERWGPRTVDLDLLLFGESIIDGERLSVPHPEMHRRAFVLVPLLELSPDLSDPRTGTPFSRYLERVGNEGVYYEQATPYTQ